ncbi:UdgX family uracil-DNA binding protein [Sphingomonas aestuarii]
MHIAYLADEDDFDGWRDAARRFALAKVAPADIVWQVGDVPGDLFAADADAPDDAPEGAFSVPRDFVTLAKSAICHSDPERFALLYTLLLQLRARPGSMGDRADPLLRRIEDMAKSVRRDIHKMRAFVRFREIAAEPGAEPRFVAWFEPDHHIVRTNAGFFVRRFASMHWSILTPELSIHWDGERLTEGPGATQADAPQGDPLEEMWRTYYASIFNPARVKIGAMTKEMPRKYWKNMPETALIPALIAGAQAREVGMVEASRRRPGGNSLVAWEKLRDEAAHCTRCPLHRHATQTVFGEGPVDAALMLVGEQPGDQEDLAGRPFVGPAGQKLDEALAAAGVDRSTIYLTNAVKHFKFEPRGKRRIHSKPDTGEIEACRWWIDQERLLVRPQITLALGATAARSLFGKAVTIKAMRGQPHALPDGGEVWVTIHPSYLLRLPDAVQADEEYHRFVEEIGMAAARVGAG